MSGPMHAEVAGDGPSMQFSFEAEVIRRWAAPFVMRCDTGKVGVAAR